MRHLKALELEEQILNGAALAAAGGVFLPWLSGEWLGGDSVTYTGFGFFTSFLGLAIFGILAFILLVTLVPMAGGPVVIRRRYREYARLFAAVQAGVLALAALSVLTKITLEFGRMEVRFGIYLTLIGSLVTVFYAFLRLQEYRRAQTHELFHHPLDGPVTEERRETAQPPPPPPPPPAPEPEEHPLYP